MSPGRQPEAATHKRQHAAKPSSSQDRNRSPEHGSQGSSQHVRSVSADNGAMQLNLQPDPLVSLGIAPHSLMRTSPALSWGQPQDASPGTELARSSSSTAHHRTHSDARSEYSAWQGMVADGAADTGQLAFLLTYPFWMTTQNACKLQVSHCHFQNWVEPALQGTYQPVSPDNLRVLTQTGAISVGLFQKL